MSRVEKRGRLLVAVALAVACACIGATPAAAGGRGADVVDLEVSGRADSPLGVDDTAPTLSWRVDDARDGWEQAAYQIRAARTERDLDRDRYLWDSGKVRSSAQTDIRYEGPALESRDTVVWQVRVWSTRGDVTRWSREASWEMGLLERGDWGAAKWIEYPGRSLDQPLPIFARSFTVGERRGGHDQGQGPRPEIAKARLYLSGVGLHEAELNGKPVSDEVLAPGNSNLQLSAEYRAYDVTRLIRRGANTLGVELGHGPALVTRSVTNPDTGRTAPYAWWQSRFMGSGTLAAPAAAGDTVVKVSSVEGYHLGGTINIDTGDGGDRLESRTITAIGTAGADGTGITFEPALDGAHASGAMVTGSGDPTASTQPTAGTAVTPRMIARLEITEADGSVKTIVSDRSWNAAHGPTVYDMWFSGSDYDSRREQRGWTEPGADLSGTATRRDGSPVGWTSAGIAPPPNLTTELVWRAGEPVEITQPQPGVWVFDFGQNFAGQPVLEVDGNVPAGTTIKMQPAESLAPDGTVHQASIMGGGGSRGTDVFATYTTHGDRRGESWHPQFNYFGMQWVQVTGLPEGYRPTKETVTGLQVSAAAPEAGGVRTSNDRINRIHRMSHYSIMSNMLSTFTDCPGREKMAYPADYTQPFGALYRHFGYDAYLRTMQRHLAEGQSKEGDNVGNVALKAPVYDWGYLGRFGDEINWGNGIVLVPWLAYETYGDTQTMERYYPQMQAFMDYIAREKADGLIVDAALADWAAADTTTSGRITGTWGYYQIADRMAKMADVLGHEDDADEYRDLAENIKEAFNDAFYNSELGRYTTAGDAGTEGATQAAQGLALDEGLVPEGERERVVDALVELIYSYQPSGGGPHFSAGTIGMAPVVRALMHGGRDDVLWDVLQEDTYPSYGFFMAPTSENPNGLTTIPERWTIRDSKNHMILLQIDEWFTSGLAGIRQAPGSVGYRDLVIDPRIVGDLTHVEGSYETPYGAVESEWRRQGDTFSLSVEVPPNTTAEVRVPMGDSKPSASSGARFLRTEGDRAVYRVPSGDYRFMARDVELGH